jgi:hypothetical protein
MFYDAQSSPSVTVKSEDSGCGFLTFNRDLSLEGPDVPPNQPASNGEIRLTVESSVEQVTRFYRC